MRDYESSSKWMTPQFMDQLKDQFFKKSPIKIDLEFKGTQCIRDNRLVLGVWAGPMQCPTHIIHEMGHLIEIDDARILKYGWGLTNPEEYIPGRYAHFAQMPITHQSTLRECRAISIARQIQNFIGIEETIFESISSLKYMSDWCCIPASGDEERYAFLENKVKEYTKKYTIEFIMREWKRKNQLLRRFL